MPLEIERRFLVTVGRPGASAGPLSRCGRAIWRRPKTVSPCGCAACGSDQAWLTLKAAADAVGLVRHEFEYPIPVADAEALWDLAPHRLDQDPLRPGFSWW